MKCTAPENCTCVPGWTGQDCLTGIKIKWPINVKCVIEGESSVGKDVA